MDQDLYRSNRSATYWDEEWGDRRTQLVFIGSDVDEAAITAALDDCVLTDAEMDEDWDTFDNPFPEDEGELLIVGE
nr:GTP-binding protein [Haladaptatus sp. W1]